MVHKEQIYKNLPFIFFFKFLIAEFPFIQATTRRSLFQIIKSPNP